jgi:hypothetical protein
MFVTSLTKWLKKQVKNTLFSRKMKSTTSVNSNLSQKGVQSNILHYNSIYDCPIWNYNQAIEKNDSRYLYNTLDYSKLPDKKIDHVLDKLFWEYMDEKGYDEKFKLAYDLRVQIAEYEFEQAQGTDKHIQIKMLNDDLRDLYKGKKQKLSEQLAILSKFMGYQLNPKQITVYDFLGIEKLFIDYGKEKSTIK